MAFTLLTLLSMSCGSGRNPSIIGGDDNLVILENITLNGIVTISPDGPVMLGKELIAVYSGSEDVLYQWKVDGVNAGIASKEKPNTFTPTQIGTYTVIVSANGYNALTSSDVIVDICIVTTFAGSGVSGFANNTGTAAQFKGPSGVVVDASGNLYICDRGNDRIRKISSAGVVTTFAGSGTEGSANGTGTGAQFAWPMGITVDNAGNFCVADFFNSRIRKITSAGVVTTLAGSTGGFANGTGTAAKFNTPTDVTVDKSGNVYVADYFRAILDLIYEGLMKYEKIFHLNCITHDYLDNDEQVVLVVAKSRLLEKYLNENQTRELDRWIRNELNYEGIRKIAG